MRAADTTYVIHCLYSDVTFRQHYQPASWIYKLASYLIKVDFDLPKGAFPLKEIFRGQEWNRKAREHARVPREQENFPFLSVPRKVESSPSFFCPFRAEKT